MKRILSLGFLATVFLAGGCSSKTVVEEPVAVQPEPAQIHETVAVATPSRVVDVQPVASVPHRHHPRHLHHRHHRPHHVAVMHHRTRHVAVIENAARGTSSGRTVTENCTTATTVVKPMEEEVILVTLVAQPEESKSAYLSRVNHELNRLDDRGEELRHTGDVARVDAFDQRLSEARRDLKRLYWSTGTNWQQYTPRMDADVKAAWATAPHRAIAR